MPPLPTSTRGNVPLESPAPADRVLDLLNPLLETSSNEAGPSRWTAQQVGAIRGNIEKELKAHKQRGHDLLISNFAIISSHISKAETIRTDHERISSRLSSIQRQLNDSDPRTSFIPPTIHALERHFNALHRREQAKLRVQALKTLSKYAERIEKLEEAVWGGRGGDDWVIEELREKQGYDVHGVGEEFLKGTKAMRSIQERMRLLRSMVVEQLTDAFNKAVTFNGSPGSESCSVIAQSQIKLQQPRIPRSSTSSATAKPSIPPPYPLTHIFSILLALGSLKPLLSTLQSRILRDIIQPLLKPPYTLAISPSTSSSDHQHTLTLNDTPSREPLDVLKDITGILHFVKSSIYPPGNNSMSEELEVRRIWFQDLHQDTWRSVLEGLIIPSLPSSISGIQSWLDLISEGITAEKAADEEFAHDNQPSIIQEWSDREAGDVWAKKRRERIAEEVRKVLIGGWGGWENTSVEQEKEITVIVEVEVDEPLLSNMEEEVHTEFPATEKEDGFGWGFEEDVKSGESSTRPIEGISTTEEGKLDEAMEEEVDDGWAFDEPVAPISPTKTKTDSAQEEEKVDGVSFSETTAPAEEGDGWDFELETAPLATASQPKPSAVSAPKKPVREAKKLGKIVAAAKAKAAAEDSETGEDGWGSGSEVLSARDTPGGAGHKDVASLLGSVFGGSAGSNDSSKHVSPVTTSDPTVTMSSVGMVGEETEGWGWNDDDIQGAAKPSNGNGTVPPPVSSTTRTRGGGVKPEVIPPTKKRELREEKRIIKESVLVSRACQKILEIFERVIHDFEELGTTSTTLPQSFAQASQSIKYSFEDIFDIYRSLITSHYAPQLKEVPVLAMQVANDHLYLASTVSSITSKQSPENESWSPEAIIKKLRDAGEAVYENQLAIQREAYVSVLDEVRWEDVASEGGYHLAERNVKQVVHNLESLARVIKPVLPPSTFFPTIGYLLDVILFQISSQILSLRDITEIESTKLNDIMKLLDSVEDLFAENGVVLHVRGWLRFSYLSELLTANLVDITYLFETGALVDFTTEELVGLLRALFADSPKRDAAIKRIEMGVPGAAGGHL